MLNELNRVNFSKPDKTAEEKKLATGQPKRYSLYEQMDISEKGINFFIGVVFLLLIGAVVYGIIN